MTSHVTGSAEVMRNYAELIDGAHSTGPAGNLSLLVSTIDISAGRGDLYVALGLSRALVKLGFGVSLVRKEDWYKPEKLTEIVVVMLPHFDVRTLPAGRLAVAWIRNETDRWIASGTLGLFDVIAASSELSRAELQAHVDTRVAVLPIGVDADLFTDPARARTVNVTTTAHHWGSDRDVHKAIRNAPANAKIRWYGVSKSKDPRVNRWNKGSVSFFDLPGKYQKSLVVIDDLNHTTKPFGNHNSRLFESLAAGSLPIVNTALGLRELGLDDLPVYRSPSELLEHIANAIAQPRETSARASRLRQIVLERHTFAVRAAEFAELIRDEAPVARPFANMIGFFPDYRATNPFQSMMYTEAVEHGYSTVPIMDVVGAPVPRDNGESLSGYVLHLHWANPILQSESDPVKALRKFEQFTANIKDIRSRGARVVWTIHNAMPHEFHHYSLELALYRFLSAEVDIIHVMGEHTFAATRNFYPLDRDKCVVIPHSSYVDEYPDFVDRRAARQRLNLRESEVVLLCMGGIRPYKGLDDLFNAFAALSKEDPRLRLIISGKPGRTVNRPELEKQISANRRVLANLEFVPDSELQVWLRAADIAVLPYRAILNSGSFHLATTFGLPIVAPNLGQIGDMAEKPYVSAFASGVPGALEAAIKHAVDTMCRPEVADLAANDSGLFTPANMSDAFFAALSGATIRDTASAGGLVALTPL